MLNESKGDGVAQGALEGARSATGSAPCAAVEVKRWSAGGRRDEPRRAPASPTAWNGSAGCSNSPASTT